ncbi:MAG: hypothetical protein QGG40_18210 [Myxococcota bacterium]|nr:hypothetical protein [Myxococcota bacterium]
MPVTAASDLDRTIRSVQATARLAMLRSLTPFEQGPQEAVLSTLVDAGGAQVTYLVAPSGGALGFSIQGEGATFGAHLAQVLTNLLDAQQAARFEDIARRADWQSLEFELVLGGTSWITAGTRMLSLDQARAALRADDIDQAEIERALAPATRAEASQVGFSLTIVDAKSSTLLVTTRGATAPSGVEQTLTGAAPVTVQHTIGWPDRTWIHRTGLDDHALVDWQLALGMGTDEATRTGQIHGLLSVNGPDEVLLRTDAARSTLVYRYVDPR